MKSHLLPSAQGRQTMTPSTFHKFPELPPEIQLQIWESSFRSPKAVPGGLHYIGLDHDGSPVPLDKTTKVEFQRARSGYELEQGLWTACWDSRAAAMKHERQQDVECGYPDVLSPVLLKFALAGRRSYARRELVSIKPPVYEGQGNSESLELKMFVCPSRDIFCVALNRAGRAASYGNYYPLREFQRLAFEFKPLAGVRGSTYQASHQVNYQAHRQECSMDKRRHYTNWS